MCKGDEEEEGGQGERKVRDKLGPNWHKKKKVEIVTVKGQVQYYLRLSQRPNIPCRGGPWPPQPPAGQLPTHSPRSYIPERSESSVGWQGNPHRNSMLNFPRSPILKVVC